MAWYKDKFLWTVMGTLAVLKGLILVYLVWGNPLGEQVLVFPDSITYIYPAQTLLAYGSLWDAFSSSPMLVRTPGYPLFIALVQLISHNATWAIALAQNLLSVLLLLPVYLSARLLAGQTAARAASVFCACSLLYMALSNAVLSDMLGVFLLAWFVYFMLRSFTTPSPKNILPAALFLAAAIYTRPACYPFAFVAFVFLYCLKAGRTKTILLFLIPLFVLVGGWRLRNYVQTGFAGFTTSNYTPLYWHQADYVSHQLSIPFEQAQQFLHSTLPPNFDALPPATQVTIYKKRAWMLLRASAWYRLSRLPLWSAKTLLGPNKVHLTRLVNNKIAAKICVGLSCLQVFLTVLVGIWGLWLVWKKNRLAGSFVTVYCLYFWLISSWLSLAYARYRAPFEFVLCIMAGIAWAHWKLQTARQAIQ